MSGPSGEQGGALLLFLVRAGQMFVVKTSLLCDDGAEYRFSSEAASETDKETKDKSLTAELRVFLTQTKGCEAAGERVTSSPTLSFRTQAPGSQWIQDDRSDSSNSLI